MERIGRYEHKLYMVSTVFNSAVMNLPQEMFSKKTTIKDFQISFDFGDKVYPVKVGAQTTIQGDDAEETLYRGYRVSLTTDLSARLNKEFPYSYMLNVSNNLPKGSRLESMTVVVYKDKDDYFFKVIDKDVYQNQEWLKMRPTFEKYIMSNQFDSKRNKENSNSHKKYLNCFHHMIPFEKRNQYKNIGKAIYMWIDANQKKIYVGLATNLTTRMNSHNGNVKVDEESYGCKIDITHFSFWSVNNLVPLAFLKALETVAITLIASLIPNRSNGKIIPLFKDTEWEIVNNQYLVN